MIRPAAVAGRFYPSDPVKLASEVEAYSPENAEKAAAIACLVPHAGYIYSGHVAGAVYSAVQIPARCILLGPRHFRRGASMAILSEGAWQTPLGEAQIDSSLAGQVRRACADLREDYVAHETEHSLEVQLPFLQRRAPNTRFVPIVLAADRYPLLEDLGHAIAGVIASGHEPVLLIATSDMNHYESDAITRTKDRLAMDRILALDPRGVYDVVRRKGITMCGYAATVAMLIAAREMGAAQAELIRYATSGDATGERDEVVGYAGIVIR